MPKKRKIARIIDYVCIFSHFCVLNVHSGIAT
ncbi:hypothetical protein SAMN05216600_101214 [Pseudomonas cuatrocienegasensis]|uniref:Uncharacterized protein n=1 Tax=Pseudomonas cuatrocienegasensis TaxID=543360 RepID=A0ABY1B0S1_9PSED|nr:hypothetical protein SAMN05216600_101214 [Pseudomonas cuatrocienegasensis]